MYDSLTPKAIVRALDEHIVGQQDAKRAVAAIPDLLPRSEADRKIALEALRRVVNAAGALTDESRRRLAEVEALFDVREPAPEQTAMKNGARTKGKTLHA